MRLDTVMVSSLFLCNLEYALRARASLAMRGSRDRMVVLAIATSTAIPTARSPGTYDSDGAWYVVQGGAASYVVYYVDNSYGLILSGHVLRLLHLDC